MIDYRVVKPTYASVEIDNDFKYDCEKADGNDLEHYAERDPKRPPLFPVMRWVAKYKTFERTWRWGGLSYPIYTLVERLENDTGTIKSHILYRRMSRSNHKTIVDAWEAGVWPGLPQLRKIIREDITDWIEEIQVSLPHHIERERRRALDNDFLDRERIVANAGARGGYMGNFDGSPSMPIRGQDNKVVGRITPRGSTVYGNPFDDDDDEFTKRWEDTFRSAGKARCPRSRPQS